MTIDQILVPGSGGAAAALVIYLVRLGYQAWRDRQADSRSNTTATVTDSQTVNAIALKTLEAVNGENKRLTLRVAELEADGRLKDEKIRELEDKLMLAQRQIQDIADELSLLKTKP